MTSHPSNTRMSTYRIGSWNERNNTSFFPHVPTKNPYSYSYTNLRKALFSFLKNQRTNWLEKLEWHKLGRPHRFNYRWKKYSLSCLACLSGRWSIKGICAKLQSAKRTTPFSRFSRPPKTPVHPLPSCGESSSTTGESERSTKGPTRRNTGGHRRQRPRYVRIPAPTNAIDDHTSARPLLAELRGSPGEGRNKFPDRSGAYRRE